MKNLPPIYRDAKKLVVAAEQAVRGFARYHRHPRYRIAPWQPWSRSDTTLAAQNRLNKEIKMKSTKTIVSAALCAVLLWAGQAYAACPPQNSLEVTRPDERYTDHGDGTVTDQVTGLIWARCSLGQNNDATCSGTAGTYHWQGALAVAQTANGDSYLGHDDWRLPNVRELRSLVDQACVSPAINTTLFPNTASNEYWTSSVYAGINTTYAWYVNFSGGHESADFLDAISRVRLVRGGQ